MDVVGCMGSGLPRLKEGGDLVLTARSEAPLKVHHTFGWIFVSWSAPVRSVSSSIAPSAQAGVSTCAKLIHTSLALRFRTSMV